MSHTNKGHRVIVQRADLSARPAISRDQSVCVSVITSTPKTPRKYGVMFYAGLLFAVILFIACLLPQTTHVSPASEYPIQLRTITTTSVIETPPLAPKLPVIIRIIPYQMHHTCGQLTETDSSTCYCSKTIDFGDDCPLLGDSGWILLSHDIFEEHYSNKSMSLEGQELCILVENLECNLRILEFL